MSSSPPSDEEKEDVLLACRYGELDEVQHFVDKFGAGALADVRDAHGNTVLHMASGNGHTDVLAFLLPRVPALAGARNAARSAPLHWAALNAHLGAAQALVRFPGGPGPALVDMQNAAGRTPLGEAELAGWAEGARWFAEVMPLDGAPDALEEDGDAVGGQDVGVEIQDADGGVAKMSVGREKAEEAAEAPGQSE